MSNTGTTSMSKSGFYRLMLAICSLSFFLVLGTGSGRVSYPQHAQRTGVRWSARRQRVPGLFQSITTAPQRKIFSVFKHLQFLMLNAISNMLDQNTLVSIFQYLRFLPEINYNLPLHFPGRFLPVDESRPSFS
ncbi:hypothetical protein [Dyadobacter sandarakinus]|uniref:Uncharacterized protein n=1 Tax=Dyadobacter sandarakinus TaxID=2747268 RepID=A0ABX7I3C5_9BACT|nr:hypothetical protein [Dyadobacter sandarakinus]QRR00238.1 hypothetical protein HWI92_04630 [Dyadobacter sandarakinus]